MNECKNLDETILIHETFTTNQLTDEELLIDLCNEIRNDNGWKEIKGGFLKEYFENTSNSKLSILKRYESYFETIGFKPINKYVETHFLLNAKFKDYQTRAYELKGIIFIYAKYEPNLEDKMKNSIGMLSKLLMPELEQLKEEFQKINLQEKEINKPLEIIMLKFPNN
jgi:hypothetical protein